MSRYFSQDRKREGGRVSHYGKRAKRREGTARVNHARGPQKLSCVSHHGKEGDYLSGLNPTDRALHKKETIEQVR